MRLLSTFNQSKRFAVQVTSINEKTGELLTVYDQVFVYARRTSFLNQAEFYLLKIFFLDFLKQFFNIKGKQMQKVGLNT